MGYNYNILQKFIMEGLLYYIVERQNGREFYMIQSSNFI